MLSIADLTSEALPQFGATLWSLDGSSLYILQYPRVSPQITNIYVADGDGRNLTLLGTVDRWMGRPRWLSDDELLFMNGDGAWFVWNRTTSEIASLYPEGELFRPEDTNRFYNTESVSPDFTMRAGFSNLAAWRAANGPDAQLSEAEQAALLAEHPTRTGFDIYFLENGMSRYVDVAGQFIKSLVWSPSGKQIAITTDYDGTDYGIFVYDLETDILQRVADAYADMYYWEYYPTWSPDERWLAFYTPDGYAIQNLIDGERIPLDPRLRGNQLIWSPIMDYTGVDCS